MYAKLELFLHLLTVKTKIWRQVTVKNLCKNNSKNTSEANREKLINIILFKNLIHPDVLRGKINTKIKVDLAMGFVTNKIQMLAKKHEDRLHQHGNNKIIQLLDIINTVRRL